MVHDGIRPIVQVKNLAVGLKKQDGYVPLIHGIDFSLVPAKTLALIGESGCGKSLTALALLRLLPTAIDIFSSTHIALQDINLMQLSESNLRRIRGRQMGIVFQEPQSALDPVMTIYEQINEVLKFHFSLSTAMRTQRIYQLLENVGIPDPIFISQHYPHQLSGGLKQRVCIAMALAGEPKVLIADEITTALDVTIQAQVLNLLKKLQVETGLAILLITHDLGVVRQIADEVLVMHAGRIVERAQADSFFKKQLHEYSKKLFAAVRVMDVGQNTSTATPMERMRQVQLCNTKFSSKHAVLLRVRDLIVNYVHKKKFPNLGKQELHILDHVSFDVRTEEIVALVGESGCGKTTVAKTIVRLIAANSGQLYLNEKNVLSLSSKEFRCMANKIQMIFQDPLSAMNPRMLVEQILLEGLQIQNTITSKQQLAQAQFWIEQVGLPVSSLLRYPHEFSGGQRSRITLARALMLNPRLLILDEPTSALDVSIQAQMLHLLKELQRAHQLSYLMVTHNLGVVRHFADYVVVMYLGRVVETGSVATIFQNPLHPYTQLLLESVPALDHINLPAPTSVEMPSFNHPPRGCHFHPRCPYVMPHCRERIPPIFSIARGVGVRCWLYDDHAQPCVNG